MKMSYWLKKENRSWLLDGIDSLAPISEEFEASRQIPFRYTNQALSF